MDGQKCVKYLLVFLSVIIFVCGGTLFAAGLMFKLDSGFLESDVVSLFNKIQYSNLPLGFICDFLAYLMMCLGGVIFLVAIIGMCGALKVVKACLWTFLVLLIFFMILEAALIGLWMSVQGRADQWLRGQMLDQLKDYQGPTEIDEVSKGWNTLFMEARCCAVNDQFKDGGTNSDYTELPTIWTSVTDKVPATCCQGVQANTVYEYENSATCTNLPSNFYTEGCYDRVVEYIWTYSIICIVACGTCLLAEVLAIITACVLIDKAKSRIADIGGSKPPPYVAIDKRQKLGLQKSAGPGPKSM